MDWDEDTTAEAISMLIGSSHPDDMADLLAAVPALLAKAARLTVERDEAREEAESESRTRINLANRVTELTTQRDTASAEAEWARSAFNAFREAVEAQADRWAGWPNDHDANGPQDYARALRATIADALIVVRARLQPEWAACVTCQDRGVGMDEPCGDCPRGQSPRAALTAKALRDAAEWLFGECESRDESALWDQRETAGIEQAGHMLLRRAAWIQGEQS